MASEVQREAPPGGLLREPKADSLVREASRPVRLPLGKTPRRQSFERRLRWWCTGLGAPAVLLCAWIAWEHSASLVPVLITVFFAVLVWAITCSFFFEQIIRPLQTLSNVVSALREDDFSFRARGARRGDAIGELALEVNALAGTLQQQRTTSVEALSLVERVMTSMPSPVLAFDERGHLRVLNVAAEHAFGLQRSSALGRSAIELGLADLRQLRDESVYSTELAPGLRDGRRITSSPAVVRWSVRRSSFRLEGVAHTLFVLSDVGAALREEERTAWQKLIRVLGHEINNSLTPIKSIAGSLRSHLPSAALLQSGSYDTAELERGLAVIEDRAASLNRFLQAYQALTRLPSPNLTATGLGPLLERVAALETRLAVELQAGPPISVRADGDQIQQLLINLVQNAADAAQDSATTEKAQPRVVIGCSSSGTEAVIEVLDNGPGLSNPANLFVPFYTTRSGGTGIGLVLARSIAVAHQGSLSLANRTDTRGCRAELRLPLAIPSA